jgi:hypothetical protein
MVLALPAVACNLTSEPPATLAPRVPQSTLTPQGAIGPQATVQAPPITDQQLPSGVQSSLPSNPSVSQQLQQVSSTRLMNDVQTLVGFENRHFLSEPAPDRGKFAARNWLINQLTAIQNSNPQTRLDVYSQSFEFQYAGETRTGENVIMVMNGTDGEAGALVIGAHYDTISSVSTTLADNFQPGANDNASGVAAVLEIARIVAQQPRRASIIFVFFDAEEPGRYGSVAFAQDYILQLRIPVRGALTMDIVGNSVAPDGTRLDNQMRVYSATPNISASRHLARLAELVARVYMPDMRVNVMDALDRSGRWGDHQSFSDLGYPAIRLIEQQDNAILAHSPQDSLDKIDPNYLTRTTQVALGTLLVMADGPSAPTLRQINSDSWRLEWTPTRDAVSYVVALRSPNALSYDLEMTVQGGTSMTWEFFSRYEAVAVAAVDANGQLGPFSKEQIIQSVPSVLDSTGQ